jgi:uncharacterized membrane protein YsdA (DUF1294 family)
MNIIGFASMGLDKRRARRGMWRIKERTLFIIAALGGSVGSMLGMAAFRHKTKHRSFTLGMPAILAAQLVIAGLVIYLLYLA